MARTVTVRVALPTDYAETSRDRANRVGSLLSAYRDVYDDGEDIETAIADMIADLLHLHHHRGDGLADEALLNRALDNYLAELAEEEEGT